MKTWIKKIKYIGQRITSIYHCQNKINHWYDLYMSSFETNLNLNDSLKILRKENARLKMQLRTHRETGDEAEEELLKAQSKIKLLESHPMMMLCPHCNKAAEIKPKENKVTQEKVIPKKRADWECDISGRNTCEDCPIHFREKCGIS